MKEDQRSPSWLSGPKHSALLAAADNEPHGTEMTAIRGGTVTEYDTSTVEAYAQGWTDALAIVRAAELGLPHGTPDEAHAALADVL